MGRLKKYCLVAGRGNGQYEIGSFDAVLVDDGVGEYNLVRVSSILPPYCEESSVFGSASGSILFIAYASLTVKEAVKIASAVAVAIPETPENHGVIMEYSDYVDKDIVIKTAKHLAKDTMKKEEYH